MTMTVMVLSGLLLFAVGAAVFFACLASDYGRILDRQYCDDLDPVELVIPTEVTEDSGR